MKWLQKKSEISDLQKELQLKKALPTGLTEFHEWADRIILGACLTSTVDSQKYALANIVATGLGPNVAFESDLFFINHLRKAAANQVALAVRDEIYAKKKAAYEAAKQNPAQPAPEAGDGKPLENEMPCKEYLHRAEIKKCRCEIFF